MTMAKRSKEKTEVAVDTLPASDVVAVEGEGGLFAQPRAMRAISTQHWPELEAMGLAPHEVTLQYRDDGSISPFCPYRPVGLSGLRTLLRIRKVRKATSERFMGEKGLPISHGMKVTYSWTDAQGDDYVGDAYVLWSDGSSLELIKSASAVRDIDDIIKTVGAFPWRESLPLRVVKVPTRHGHYCLSVEIA